MTSFGKAFPVGLNTTTTTTAATATTTTTATTTNHNNIKGHINYVPDLSRNTIALGVYRSS